MNKIPIYPKFRKLDIELRDEFAFLAGNIEPYSEFNFTNTFVWDTTDSARVSQLNNNLVIQIPDFFSNQVLSVIGENLIDGTFDTLFNDFSELKLIPETVIDRLSKTDDYKIEPDRDQFDYIFTTDQIIKLPGGDLKRRRNHSKNFTKNYLDVLDVRKTNFKNNDHKDEIRATFLQWTKDKKHPKEYYAHEQLALERILKYACELNQVGIQVFIDGKCVGFSINEVVHEKYAMSRFQKTLLEFDHLDIFLSSLVAGELKHFGCEFISWEADNGLVGLRQYKSSYKPYKLLKKYTVTKI